MWTVMIVDDEKIVCSGIKKIIEKSDLNFTVVGVAHNGSEGYDLAMTLKPDLIITDIYMPKQNGIEMIEALRKQKITSEVIILSGYAEFKHARDALKLNIRDYLSKPASRNTLLTSLAEIDRFLTETHDEKKTSKRYKIQVDYYMRNITQQLLESSVKQLINPNDLSTTQERIIHIWNRATYTPIKYKFKLNQELWGHYSHHAIHFGIENILSEQLRKLDLDYFYIILDAEHFILLIKDPIQDAKADHDKLAILTQLSKTFVDFFKSPFDYDVGVPTNDWQETIESIRHLLHDGEFEPDMKQISLMKQSLTTALQNLDINETEAILKGFFKEAQVFAYINTSAFNISLELLSIFKYELEKLNIELSNYLDDDENLFQMFLSFNSWDDLLHFYTDLIAKIKAEPLFEENIKHATLIQKAICYVEKNIHRRFTLNELAQELYISNNYLGRIFKERMAMSFNEYVTKRRIAIAREKLLTGDYMIYEVAELVGFDNPAYFTSVFKKITGYPPSQLIHD